MFKEKDYWKTNIWFHIDYYIHLERGFVIFTKMPKMSSSYVGFYIIIEKCKKKKICTTEVLLPWYYWITLKFLIHKNTTWALKRKQSVFMYKDSKQKNISYSHNSLFRWGHCFEILNNKIIIEYLNNKNVTYGLIWRSLVQCFR